MKKFVDHRFHSTMLIPGRVIKESNALGSQEGKLEHILLWIDAHQSDYYFKPGESVYHKSNLDQEMFVDRIIKKSYKQNGHDQIKMVGVDVHWWEENPSLELV